MRLFLLLLLVAGNAWGACSGTGGARYCTSGTSASEITSAVGAVGDNGVVTLQAGTYTLSAAISLNGRNGITLICEAPAAAPAGCNISRTGGDAITIDSIPTTRTNLIRVSGMNITGSGGTAKIWFYGANDLQKVRIDNNRFTIGASEIAIITGSTGGSFGCVFGVIDHNLFTATNNFLGWKSLGCGAYSWEAGLQGTGRNMFFEDNTCSFTNVPDTGSGCVDAWLPAGVVIRYNTLYNSRLVNHSMCHGGPANSEIYGNTVENPAMGNYRNIHWQGSGETIGFDNIVYSGSSSGIALIHYRASVSGGSLPQGDCTVAEVCDGDWTGPGVPGADGNRSGQAGYPCWRQPGRDVNAQMRPIYFWNNRDQSGTRKPVSIETPGATYTGLAANCANTDAGRLNCHLQYNRDIFEAPSASAQTSATSPFNGTSGMGFGTFARRPTTCSAGTNIDSADSGKSGVGYWATDVKTLYRCSATNTWVVHYRPYVYPHPLVSGKPAPPANPRVQ